MIKPIVEYVHSPMFINEDGSKILCMVKFDTLKQEAQFVASKYDCEEHGREIWKKCVDKEFGEVQPYKKKEFEQKTMEVNTTLPNELKDLNLFLNEVNKENAKNSCFGVVILWGTYINDALGEYINEYKNTNKIYGKTDGFNEKIRYAEKNNLFSTDDIKRLDNIRLIRNEFGHEWNFEHNNEEIINYLKVLYDLDHSEYMYFKGDLDFLIRQFYAGSCGIMVMKIKQMTIEKNRS